MMEREFIPAPTWRRSRFRDNQPQRQNSQVAGRVPASATPAARRTSRRSWHPHPRHAVGIAIVLARPGPQMTVGGPVRQGWCAADAATRRAIIIPPLPPVGEILPPPSRSPSQQWRGKRRVAAGEIVPGGRFRDTVAACFPSCDGRHAFLKAGCLSNLQDGIMAGRHV